jgi:hypothetical protein
MTPDRREMLHSRKNHFCCKQRYLRLSLVTGFYTPQIAVRETQDRDMIYNDYIYF